MNVSIGQRWEEFVEGVVRDGRYGSASEVVREGLRLVEEREAKLAALRRTIEGSIAEGGAQGQEEVAASLAAKARSLAAEGFSSAASSTSPRPSATSCRSSNTSPERAGAPRSACPSPSAFRRDASGSPRCPSTARTWVRISGA